MGKGKPASQAGGRTKEISDEAQLPEEGEEEIDVPRPPLPEDEEPKPGDYGSAKVAFKRKMELENLKGAAKERSEEMLEDYAKQNMAWLYDLYKMGALSKDEFLAKVREKISQEEGENPEGGQGDMI